MSLREYLAVLDFKSLTKASRACGVLAPGSFPSAGGFQLYTVTPALVTVPLPDHVSFEQGAVFPLTWFTAAGALLDSGKLALTPPSFNTQPQNKTVFVSGGSSSVGANALQLLRSAGYEVVTTASAKNHALVKSLGATSAINHSSSDVKQQILDALKGKELAGTIDCIGSEGPEGTLELCIQVVLEHTNAVKKIVSVIPGQGKASRGGVEVLSVFAGTDVETGVSGKAWREFMPKALETKVFLPKPDPEVVGNGLEDIQKALGLYDAGVSAKKLIVAL